MDLHPRFNPELPLSYLRDGRVVAIVEPLAQVELPVYVPDPLELGNTIHGYPPRELLDVNGDRIALPRETRQHEPYVSLLEIGRS